MVPSDSNVDQKSQKKPGKVSAVPPELQDELFEPFVEHVFTPEKGFVDLGSLKLNQEIYEEFDGLRKRYGFKDAQGLRLCMMRWGVKHGHCKDKSSVENSNKRRPSGR